MIKMAQRTSAAAEMHIAGRETVRLRDDMAIMITYHVKGETSAIKEWVCSDKDWSIEALVKVLDDSMPRRLWNIMKDPTPGRARPATLLSQLRPI